MILWKLHLLVSSYIFTDFQTINETGPAVAAEYEKAAKRRGCPFISIILECQLSENEKRMRSSERLELVAGGKGMLLDTAVLRGFRKKGQIFRFQDSSELEIDITKTSPAQAAQKILAHIEEIIKVSESAED